MRVSIGSWYTTPSGKRLTYEIFDGREIPHGPEIEFREGLPDPSDYTHDGDKKKLLILDDLMRQACMEVVSDLFPGALTTKICRYSTSRKISSARENAREI